MLDDFQTGKPDEEGFYERRYGENNISTDWYDGRFWRYAHSMRLCVMQTKPWRPVPEGKK